MTKFPCSLFIIYTTKLMIAQATDENILKVISEKNVPQKHLQPQPPTEKLSEDELMEAYLQRQSRADPWPDQSCDRCVYITLQVRDWVKKGTPVDIVIREAVKLCIDLKIRDDRMCATVVPLYREEIMYVAANLELDPSQACGIVIGASCGTPYNPGEMWNVTFPPTPKPTPKPPTPPNPSSPTLRFLQLTDIHIDFDYREGASAVCGEPLCCRANDLFNDTQKAGKYGDYRSCDAPMSLAESLFSHLSTVQDQFDYIIMTGDIPAHDTWNQSKTDQIAHLVALDKLFNTYLPNKPVYSCIGNHESSPMHSFPPPTIPVADIGWLYGALAQSWGKWLPQSALETVVSCGGFSISPFPGFRIISINDNYCNKGNLWLLLDTKDPCNALQWLIGELQNAEDKGEKVHMLLHIPPGEGDCLKAWSYNYFDIVNREVNLHVSVFYGVYIELRRMGDGIIVKYENTIVNQFYGHSHRDWFEMFYDNVNFQRPVGFGFIAPSVTPGGHINPIYKIYTMDGNYTGSSWAVLDVDSYYLNLTEANQSGNPVWKYEFSPRQLFKMPSLYAADWDNLVKRMEADDDLLQLFNLYKNNLYPQSKCTGICRSDLLCGLVEGRSYDPELCKKHMDF